jgi:hypothetical protein
MGSMRMRNAPPILAPACVTLALAAFSPKATSQELREGDDSLTRVNAESAVALSSDDIVIRDSAGTAVHGVTEAHDWLRSGTRDQASLYFRSGGVLHRSGISLEVIVEVSDAAGTRKRVPGQATVHRGRITSLWVEENKDYPGERPSEALPTSVVVLALSAGAIATGTLYFWQNSARTPAPSSAPRLRGHLIRHFGRRLIDERLRRLPEDGTAGPNVESIAMKDRS